MFANSIIYILTLTCQLKVKPLTCLNNLLTQDKKFWNLSNFLCIVKTVNKIMSFQSQILFYASEIFETQTV